MNFSAKGHADYLGQKFGIPGDLILQFVFSEPSHFKGALYPDVIPAFIKLKEQSYILGIFSEGHIENQQNKLKHTGLMDYLDSSLVYLFDRKMKSENLSQIPKVALIVEDNEEIVATLQENGYKALLLSRTNGENLLSILSLKG
jgi:phosphoglycolate phosphatase-like HAD superfamily hydrolase